MDVYQGNFVAESQRVVDGRVDQLEITAPTEKKKIPNCKKLEVNVTYVQLCYTLVF